MDWTKIIAAANPTSWWMKALPYAIAAAALLAAFWQYTVKVQLEATQKNDKVWEARLAEFDKKAQDAIINIHKRSTVLSNNADALSKRQLAETQLALTAISEKALAGEYLIIQDGRCTFKPEFIDSFNRVRNSLPGATK